MRLARRKTAETYGRDFLDSFTEEGIWAGGSDGPLWRDWNAIPLPQPDKGFWQVICNGNNDTFVDQLAETSGLPTDGWTVAADTSCIDSGASSVFDSENTSSVFDDETAAVQECGAACASILDVGCQRKQFRLCRVGGTEVTGDNANSNCLRRRLPDHGPPAGKPDPPKYKEFWAAFCEKSGPPFRVLFEHRLCETATELDFAQSEGRCAELVEANADCSDVFDYAESKNPVCRCVPKGTQCVAKLANSTLVNNIYIRLH